MEPDSFTKQIIRNFLFATTEEMIQTTVLTAYSPTFSEGYDFSCALFDRSGRMVIQSRGIGVHLGSLVGAMRAIVAKFPKPEPGDVFITNNPYLATHQSDVVVCRPMFDRDVHLGFAVNIGHWTDIGGMSAGGCAGTSTHVVQDELIIPLSRLYRRGELVEETRDFILANVRLPEDDWGDLMSQISATGVAETRIRELCSRYGSEGVLAGMEAAIDYSRERFLSRMREIPDGAYEAIDYIEDDGLTDACYAIRVKVTKRREPLRRGLHRDVAACADAGKRGAELGARGSLHGDHCARRSSDAGQRRHFRSHRARRAGRNNRQRRLAHACLWLHIRNGQARPGDDP